MNKQLIYFIALAATIILYVSVGNRGMNKDSKEIPDNKEIPDKCRFIKDKCSISNKIINCKAEQKMLYQCIKQLKQI